MLGEMRHILVPRDSNQSQAADIILLVDESGSMEEEHSWIPAMTQSLDEALMEIGIGISPKNYFGIVGFGDCDANNNLGRLLVDDSNQFASAGNISNLLNELNIGGREEDGYSAIETALNGYPFREVARQFILITDEDRDVLASHLTRDLVRDILEASDVCLNAAISEEFLGEEGMRALGVDSFRNAYLYDPSVRSSFRVEEGAGAALGDSAFGSTSRDYTELAWDLGGAVWDLSLLRRGTVTVSWSTMLCNMTNA